ncbi:MAG: TIGR02281 family clan AA aspartic protease [Phycisphaerae bacterium]|nr:retropepsin-like aspartic protease [Tepidisphaeraceae bacterium]
MPRLGICLLLLVATLPARGADSIFADKVDPKAAPETYLQAKGLLKAGANYVLQVDANLPTLLRDVRAAKVKADAATARRADLERQIERAKDAYIAAQREVAAVSEQMSKVKKGDTRRYNELVGESRAADVRRLEAGRVIEAKQKELARATEGQHDYVGLTVALAEQMQAAAKQYAALAADPGTAAAIAAINVKGGAKVALGPSGQFTAELAAALQARDVVAARAIKLTFEGGTPHALVTLNGKTSILMTVDSGASLVTVTTDVAKDMGLKPDPGVDPLVLVVADGKRVEARQATIASVRVGPYTVSDVKCAIMPASVKGSNLLGGTFLRNFTVRLDIAARELHMTPVGPQVLVSATPVTPVTPATGETGAPKTEPPTGGPPPGAATTKPSSERVVRLLPLVDPDKDTVKGAFELVKGELVTRGKGQQRIELPYKPPREYDFRVEFTRTDGKDVVIQICARDRIPFIWVMQDTYIFHYLKKGTPTNNHTKTKGPGPLKNGVRHTSVLQVRDTGVQSFVDGELVTDWKTDYTDVNAGVGFWALRDKSLLGLGVGGDNVIFHAANVTEVTGSGTPTRAAAPGPAQPEAAKPAFSPVGVWIKVDSGTKFTFQPDGTLTAPDTQGAVYRKGNWNLPTASEVKIIYAENRWTHLELQPDGTLKGRTSVGGEPWVLRRE